MPSKKEFVANNLTIEQVREVLGADGLMYQNVDDMVALGKSMNTNIEEFDTSCFTGHYVTKTISETYLASLEADGRGKGRSNKGEEKSTSSSSSAASVPT